MMIPARADAFDFSGGESVYCINESQRNAALALAGDPVAGVPIRRALERLENELGRNERAAVAFLLIERLLGRS